MIIAFRYTNHSGRVDEVRYATPIGDPREVFTDKYYPLGTWVMPCYCHTRNAKRDFALHQMSDIRVLNGEEAKALNRD